MKNKFKYKNPQERENEFAKFCTRCEGCVLEKVGKDNGGKDSGGVFKCAFWWLELEAGWCLLRRDTNEK